MFTRRSATAIIATSGLWADQARGVAVRDFAQWGVSQPGQDYAAQLGYLPLSDDVLDIGKQALGGLTY